MMPTTMMPTTTEPRRAKTARPSSTANGETLASEANGAGGVVVTEASANIDGELGVSSSLEPFSSTRNKVRLVPIIPPHEVLSGAMDVDMECSRLGRCSSRCR